MGAHGEKVAEELPQRDNIPLGIPAVRRGRAKGRHSREQQRRAAGVMLAPG